MSFENPIIGLVKSYYRTNMPPCFYPQNNNFYIYYRHINAIYLSITEKTGAKSRSMHHFSFIQ